MIMSDTLLIALGIAAAGALAGIIGTLADTKNKGGLKVFLVLVLLGAAGATGYSAQQREQFAKAETARAEEALRMAKESGRLAGDELVKNELFRQKVADEKEKLLADRKNNAAITQLLTASLLALNDKVGELGDAAAKARKKDIAEAAEAAQLETSKKLYELARQQEILGVTESMKMEKSLSKDTPLKTKDLEKLSEKLKAKLEKSPIEEAETP